MIGIEGKRKVKPHYFSIRYEIDPFRTAILKAESRICFCNPAFIQSIVFSCSTSEDAILYFSLDGFIISKDTLYLTLQT